MSLSMAILDWDSDFFGFKTAKIDAAAGSTNYTDAFEWLETNEVKLAYLFSDAAISGFGQVPENFEIKFADEKTTYLKAVVQTIANDNISYYDKQIPEQKLIDLAIQSGMYSRFNTDAKIGKDKFEMLYRLWIANSVSKQIASETIVFRIAQEIVGFVTVGEKNQRADIGIIAVDAAFRGQSIGKKLMAAAENWASGQKYTHIQVITQGDNAPACKLYESCGYTIEKTAYIYHIWRK